MGIVIAFPTAQRQAAVRKERDLASALGRLEHLLATAGGTPETAIPVEVVRALITRITALGGEAQVIDILERADRGELRAPEPAPAPVRESRSGTYSEDQAREMGYSRGKGFKGSAYEATRDLDIREIAKLVRKDIKAAVKAGKLPKGTKTSVRISRYSGGQSLRVGIKAVPEGFTVRNPEYDEYNRNGAHWLTEAAREMKATIETIVGRYNRDNSDTMSDYFDVRFYSTVEFEVGR